MKEIPYFSAPGFNPPHCLADFSKLDAFPLNKLNSLKLLSFHSGVTLSLLKRILKGKTEVVIWEVWSSILSLEMGDSGSFRRSHTCLEVHLK